MKNKKKFIEQYLKEKYKGKIPIWMSFELWYDIFYIQPQFKWGFRIMEPHEISTYAD